MDRMTALNQGLIKYKMDHQCRKGHDGYRYTSTGQCTECLKIHQNKLKARVRRAKEASLAGEVIVRVEAHIDDMLALDAFADALRIQRRIIQDDELRKQMLMVNGAS